MASSRQEKGACTPRPRSFLACQALFSSRIRVAGRQHDKPVPSKALQTRRATNLLVFWTPEEQIITKTDMLF